ncbi:MAG: DUF1501 domain-containing protein [Candidatus Korobacteraceae bacterium]
MPDSASVADIGFCFSRRDWLRSSGAAAIGLHSLLAAPGLLRAAENPGSRRRARAVIFIMLPGGIAQQESFDMKPLAAAGIRGEFQPIATTVPGLDICEFLPMLATRARKFALVRSMSHLENNHFPATHKVLTGHPLPRQLPGDAENAQSRHDWPCYSGAYNAVRPRGDGIPNGVALPHVLSGAGINWPGQYGGFLGTNHDPWQVIQDPNSPNFREETLALPAGISIHRLGARQQLLSRMELQRSRLIAAGEAAAFGEQQTTAFNVLTAGRLSTAFDLAREPADLRDRYGRHQFGQSLLLARRLVEAGVTIVQVNMGVVQTWDTHENNFGKLRNELLTPLDRAVSTLLDDLGGSGLLDETLVLMASEFGRTPQISLVPGAEFVGRNHWAPAYTAFFAGAGVRGGEVIGKTDEIGAYPTTRSYTPDDLGTTLFAALGLEADTEFRDRFDRPYRLCSGEVIEALYGA